MGLTVRRAFAYTLDTRLPTALSTPSRSSVTFWEDTAPVKLTGCHCPALHFGATLLDSPIPKGGISLLTLLNPKAQLRSLPLMLSIEISETVTAYS